jgi:hypothetical protein
MLENRIDPFTSALEAQEFLNRPIPTHWALQGNFRKAWMMRQDMARQFLQAYSLSIPTLPAPSPGPEARHAERLELAPEPTNPFIRPGAAPLRIPLIS